MTMNLLKQIAGSRLPLTFYRTEDIDQVRVLRAAGLVVAMFSSAAHAPHAPSMAQVLAITQKGREELAKFPYPESRPPRWRFRMPRIKTAPWAKLLRPTSESREPTRMQ
ncbi:hypothetical protein [Variovorax sp. RCC_210]|jgi:hypothetical protein|uniref:hypothetical protein n=1 Tax=Variovorax sp. RCC_210 TaxID=3239217 RepID=UPI000D5F8FF8